jgi:hypothetical protein
MIKDAIANLARDRNLPNLPSHNRLKNIRNLREWAMEFDSPQEGVL